MSKHRLSRNVLPARYDLHIQADPTRPHFIGTVKIDVSIEDETDTIELHAGKMSFESASIEQADTINATPSLNEDTERLTLKLDAPVQPGTATITIVYKGEVRSDMAGMYLSKDGDESCLATQCEATDARTIVPCWDEPDCKAVWQWTVTAPKGYTVLTNGALSKREEAGKKVRHSFEPTPPMSSYLIACAIGHFAATPDIDSRDTPFRVWAMEGHESNGVHGNKLAARMLPWYEDYFGEEYAFGKYDQIAVPSFAFGAMENAGLVLFRPSLLLLDERTASWNDRRHVALVVAHEFAHMWFGDLVTMAWWDDLWLNEAFAEWIAHKCAHAMDPSLDVWAPFRQRAAGALATDALASTHAIYHPVKTPEEAQEMFDAITYGKGSAVMRMLESYLGAKNFQKGLQSYMGEFRFSNAHGADLWRHLAKASGEDVAGIMGDWVKQAGHPTLTCAWDGKLHVSQARTVSNPLTEVPETMWRTPMVIRYQDSEGVKEHRALLSEREATIELPVSGTLSWLWPNAADGGFYRIALDDDLMGRLLAHYEVLDSAEQVGMLRDLWLEVRNGQAEVERFLEVLEHALPNLGHYEVAEYVVGLLRGLEGLLWDQPEALAGFRSWVEARLMATWAEIDANADADEPTRQQQAAILRAVGGIAGAGPAVAFARSIAKSERADPVKVDSQLAGAAVAIEAMQGDAKTLELHLATYRQRRDQQASPQEVERYLYMLPAFRQPELVDAVLKTLVNDGVAAQAEGPILRAMLASPHSGRQAWAYVQENWTRVEERLGEAWLGILVEACGELPVDETNNVTAFFDEKLNGRAGQSYMRAQERLQERAEFQERVLPRLVAWAGGVHVPA